MPLRSRGSRREGPEIPACPANAVPGEKAKSFCIVNTFRQGYNCIHLGAP